MKLRTSNAIRGMFVRRRKVPVNHMADLLASVGEIMLAAGKVCYHELRYDEAERMLDASISASKMAIILRGRE